MTKHEVTKSCSCAVTPSEAELKLLASRWRNAESDEAEWTRRQELHAAGLEEWHGSEGPGDGSTERARMLRKAGALFDEGDDVLFLSRFFVSRGASVFWSGRAAAKKAAQFRPSARPSFPKITLPPARWPPGPLTRPLTPS